MRDISRVVLARDAAAALRGAACKELGPLWNGGETAILQAESPSAARRAAEPLVAVCVECPVVRGCRRWAEIDSYTGVAAGEIWASGSVWEDGAGGTRRPMRRPGDRRLAG